MLTLTELSHQLSLIALAPVGVSHYMFSRPIQMGLSLLGVPE